MAEITVKAEIVSDGVEWFVNTMINGEPLAIHGPIPTQELADKIALEQISIAKKVLAKATADLRQTSFKATN